MIKKKPEGPHMWYTGKTPCTIKGIGHVQPNHVVSVPKELVDSLAEDKYWDEVEISVKEKKKKSTVSQSTTQRTEEKIEKKEVKNGSRK